MEEITYRNKWVLINAYFYSFWMLRTDFNKYSTKHSTKHSNEYPYKY